MPISDDKRARIFMPFSALKGFEEAIRQKEHIVVDKKILSEDENENIDFKIKQLKKNMMVEVIYYEKDEYIKLTGVVTKIDIENRFLVIVKKKIMFDSINDLKGESIIGLSDFY